MIIDINWLAVVNFM